MEKEKECEYVCRCKYVEWMHAHGYVEAREQPQVSFSLAAVHLVLCNRGVELTSLERLVQQGAQEVHCLLSPC